MHDELSHSHDRKMAGDGKVGMNEYKKIYSPLCEIFFSWLQH